MLHIDVEGLGHPAIQALQCKRLAELGRRLEGQPDWTAHFAAAGMRPSDLAADDGLANAPFECFVEATLPRYKPKQRVSCLAQRSRNSLMTP
jgi:hypothetical protein